MTKVTTSGKKLGPAKQAEADKTLAAYEASQKFISTALTMGWQLAVTVLVPVFIGSRIDGHFQTAPAYTLVALGISVVMAVLVVAHTVKEVAVPVEKGGKKS